MKHQDTNTLDIRSLLTKGMGARLHWFPERVSVSRLAAVLVGMANTSGGVVLLGIAPRSGHIQGVKDPHEAIDRVFQAALLADPLLVLPVPRIQEVDRLKVLMAIVPSGLPHVYSLDGRYLARDGARVRSIPARRLRKLLLERGVIQFESQIPPGGTVDDLDPQKVDSYVQDLDLPGNETSVEILTRRGCLRQQDERDFQVGTPLLPTYAGLLLFGKHPQRWLHNSTILAARFSGVNMADHFVKQEISGVLPDQLRKAESFVRENLRSVVRLVGLTRYETTEYPLEAVRELLVNAVAHRDYNIQGDNIHVNIFVDRIEVYSPGMLPGPVNLHNLLDARFSRNAVIVQVLSDMGFVERLGYGLDRVMTVMHQNNLREPQFKEVAGSFCVTLYGDADMRETVLTQDDLQAYKEFNLNPRQELAIGYLIRRRRITNREYQELCPDVHPETLRRDLVGMVKSGLTIKVGDKRATYYILKK